MVLLMMSHRQQWLYMELRNRIIEIAKRIKLVLLVRKRDTLIMSANEPKASSSGGVSHAKSAVAIKSDSDHIQVGEGFAFSAMGYKVKATDEAMVAATVSTSGTKPMVPSSTNVTSVASGPKTLKRLVRPGEKNKSQSGTSVTPPKPPNLSVADTSRAKLLQSAKKPGPTSSQAGKPIEASLKMMSWGIDTMASIHCSGNKAVFSTRRKCSPMIIQCANGDRVIANETGTVRLRVRTLKGTVTSLEIRDVYYSPDMGPNLLSGILLTREFSTKIVFGGGVASMDFTDGMCIPLSTRGNILTLEGGGVPAILYSAVSEHGITTIDELVSTHARLGHMGFDRMIKTIELQKTRGLGQLKMNKTDMEKARDLVMNCVSCKMAKSTDESYSKRAPLNHGTAIGEVLHFDTFECRLSNDTVHYGLVTVEPFSGALMCRRVLSKDLIVGELLNVIKVTETCTRNKIKFLYTDGGTEFINRTLKNYCHESGTTLHYPPPGVPAWNGIAERAVRTVKEGGRTLLKQSGLPDWSFWYHAVSHFIYVWNRTFVSKHTGITPYESYYRLEPSVRSVNVFGCDVFVWMSKVKRDQGTFASRGEPGVYLGHDSVQNCAVVWLLKSQKEIRTRAVSYREDQFNYASAIRVGPNAVSDVINRSDVGGPLAWSDSDSWLDDNDINSANDDHDDALLGDEVKLTELDDGVSTNDELMKTDIESDNVESEWDVESILNHRSFRNKGVQYEIKWVGDDKTTWEPIDNLIGTCDILLNEYRIKNGLQIDDTASNGGNGSSSVASSSQ